jgi:hypothetical protein
VLEIDGMPITAKKIRESISEQMAADVTPIRKNA